VSSNNTDSIFGGVEFRVRRASCLAVDWWVVVCHQHGDIYLIYHLLSIGISKLVSLPFIVR